MNVSKISQMFCLLMIPGAGMASAIASGMTAENFSVMQQAGKISVQGVVVDTKGEPLIGVSILESGTTNGTITDIDGKFTLSVYSKALIELSYIGYKSQKLPAKADLGKIVMQEDTEVLDEVVVTALGIKRSQKALSYNVQEVKNDALTTVKDANFVNSLVGKVAGVQINAGAGGPGSTTKVVMRGMKSIEKNNNVLYVIDGIPMYNNSLGGDGGTFGNPVSSESAADINPDDIESISMLTGASAAALYGSSAANGVIMITTKRGAEGRTSVTISNSTTFSKVCMLPEMQSRYGNSENMGSWGELINGDYDPAKFFNTGTNIINSISLSTGNEKNQTYISASTTNTKGVVPESDYNRYNFTARNTTKFAHDKLVLDFGASFILQDDQNLVSQGKYFNPLPALYLFPRGNNFDEIRLYERWDPVRGMNAQYWPVGEGNHSLQNPYWLQNRNMRENKKRRYMFDASLQYNVTDWLNVKGRVRVDEASYERTRKYYATTLTTFCGENGGYQLDNSYDRSFYADVIASVDKSWGDWRLTANLGASINDTRYNNVMNAGDLLLANHFALNNVNTAEKYKTKQDGWHDQVQSVFGAAELSWKDMWFLSVTGRNEWASQLAYTNNTSFFYPSVGLSAIVSKMVQLPEWFSFLKVRGSYSQVASPIDRWLSNPSYKYNDQTHNWEQPKTYPAYDLKPEDTKSLELGLNMSFLDNTITVDATYYKSNTYHQTIYVPLAASTGYDNFVAQTGNVQNQGLELAVGYKNTWGDFSLSSSFTYSFNQNKIKELAHGMIDPIEHKPVEDITEIKKDWLGAQNLAPRVILREGGSLTDIYVNNEIARDLNGNVQISTSGNMSMQETEFRKVGSLAAKGYLGWSNTLGYKGLSLGFVFSARLGGLVYSATQGILDYYGVSEVTASARDNGGVPVNYGMIDAKNYYQTIATADGGYGAYYLYDATNIRLQELSLNYTLPQKWFNQKAKLTLGFVAKNLAMLYCKAPFDPEVSAATNSNFYQGVDYFMQPNTRNFGFNVKLQF